MKEILNKTVEVQHDFIVITEETQTKKDRRQLDNELVSIQRQISATIEQNKRVIAEYTRLQIEEQTIKDMIAQLPQDDLEIIG